MTRWEGGTPQKYGRVFYSSFFSPVGWLFECCQYLWIAVSSLSFYTLGFNSVERIANCEQYSLFMHSVYLLQIDWDEKHSMSAEFESVKYWNWDLLLRRMLLCTIGNSRDLHPRVVTYHPCSPRASKHPRLHDTARKLHFKLTLTVAIPCLLEHLHAMSSSTNKLDVEAHLLLVCFFFSFPFHTSTNKLSGWTTPPPSSWNATQDL